MTTYAQDHFHLYAETTTFTGDQGHFRMYFQGHQFKVDAAVKAARGVTGKLLINRLLSAGIPIKFRDKAFTIVVSHAECDALELLNGVNCYFIPNWHEDGLAHGATYAYKVLPMITSKTMLDPGEAWFLMSVQLQENTL